MVEEPRPASATPIDLELNRRRLLAVGAAAAVGAGVGPSTAAADEHDSADGGGVFLAAMTGDQQPEPTDTGAGGAAVFSLDEAGEELEYALLVNAIEDVTMAHIHLGAAGEEGPIAVWLAPSPEAEEPELIEGRFDGVLATDTITEENLTDEVEDFVELLEVMEAATAYVNVHTEAFPDGEIRGQTMTVDDAAGMLADGAVEPEAEGEEEDELEDDEAGDEEAEEEAEEEETEEGAEGEETEEETEEDDDY